MEQTAEALIDGALRAARAGDWAAYRVRFAALRDGCAALIEQHEELRQHFETLGAALAAPAAGAAAALLGQPVAAALAHAAAAALLVAAAAYAHARLA